MRAGSIPGGGPARRRLAASCLVLAGLGAAVPVATAAEGHRFRHVRTDDGLTQASVNDIVQDRQGRIWFGTQDGLNRFDGYTLRSFRHDPEDETTLGADFVWDVLVAADGSLWVALETAGVARWNPADDSFVRIPIGAGAAGNRSDRNARSLAEGPDRTLWIGTEDGLTRLDMDSGRYRTFTHDPYDRSALAGNRVTSVEVDRRGRLWVGIDGGGVDRLDPGAERFVHHRHRAGDDASLSGDRVRAVREGPDGAMWIGTYETGLNRLDPDTGRVRRYGTDAKRSGALSHDRVRSILTDELDRLWVGTDDGLNRLSDDGTGFDVYRRDPTDPHGLSSNRILALFQDRGGLLWVATQGGVDRFDPTPPAFHHVKQDPGRPSTLSADIVTSFAEQPNGTVWIGTYGGGLNRHDPATDRYDPLRHDAADPRSLGDDRVMALYTDRSGRLWAGTMAGGLSRLRDDGRSFDRWTHDPDDASSLSSDRVTAILQDSRGTIWVGTHGGGLNRMHDDERAFDRFRHRADDPGSLGHDRVMALHEDGAGVLWVGTMGGGLSRLDPETGRIDRVGPDDGNPRSLSRDLVVSIHESGDGTFWIGTRGGGLNRWEPADRAVLAGRFRHYGVEDGLPDATIYGILEDDRGRLWLSTNLGLSRFDPVTGATSNFDATHGLQGDAFNFGAALRLADGDLLFGGNNGFNRFRPDEIGRNPHVPPVLLTGILKRNERVRFDRPVWELDQLELSHGDDVISFEFAALDFTAPELNRYAYKLEGFDRDWIELGGMRRATYTNLDPGEYLLRVRGSNNDQVWNETGVTLPVRVLPPPWRSWWAYTVYALILVGSMLVFVRVHSDRLQREEETTRRLEQQVAQRTAELALRNEELARANNMLEETSLSDSLTGLRNRRYLMTYIQDDISLRDRRYRSGGSTGIDRARPRDFAFMMIDLDGFKPINDRYGHATGDLTLIAVRNRLREVCRSSDALIRWGGDEFLVVAREADRQAIAGLAERIRQAIADLRIQVGGGRSVGIGCSIGFAFYPFLSAAPTTVRWERVLAVADRALYLAKDNGRNAWVGIHEGPRANADDPVEAILDDPLDMARRGVIVVECGPGLASLSAGPVAAGPPAARRG